MGTILRVFSRLAGLLLAIGLLVRVFLIGLVGAAFLRVAGVVDPQLLPAFWAMLGAALFIAVAPAWAAGADEVRRGIRDKKIAGAIKEYEEG